jgi:hypothetical protein
LEILRPTIKELLNHSIFLKKKGLQLNVIKDKNRNIMSVDKAIINFRIQRINERKGELNNENNKSIEFRYHMNKDKPENILQELVFF